MMNSWCTVFLCLFFVETKKNKTQKSSTPAASRYVAVVCEYQREKKRGRKKKQGSTNNSIGVYVAVAQTQTVTNIVERREHIVQ